MSNNVTLRDIASKSGFSRSTVSLVMQNSTLVADDTREAVQKAADELGYVYNRAAASLRSKQTGIFGLIISSLSNPFFAETTLGIETIFGKTENTVLLGQHSENIHNQERMIRSMLEMRVDGLILVPVKDTPKSAIALLEKWKVPTVLLSRRIKGVKIIYVGPDNFKVGKEAADHLFFHNRKRLAFIGGQIDGGAHTERLEGIFASAAAHNFSKNKIEIIGERATREAGYNAVTKLLEAGKMNLGIVAYNDIVAFGAMSALRDAGLTIGKDVSIIGIDNVEASRYEDPAMSTVSIDAARMGVSAAGVLLKLVSGNATAKSDLILDSELVIRKSCGCNQTKRGN